VNFDPVSRSFDYCYSKEKGEGCTCWEVKNSVKNFTLGKIYQILANIIPPIFPKLYLEKKCRCYNPSKFKWFVLVSDDQAWDTIKLSALKAFNNRVVNKNYEDYKLQKLKIFRFGVPK
jgi:hypothetical protein